MKAAHAQKSGWLRDEITEYKTVVKDKEGEEKEVVVDCEDGIRPKISVEKLGKLKPVFKKGGTTTAGNSSQVSDGAAAVLLTRRSYAEKHGLPIRGRMLSYAAAGVPPELNGIGPIPAIRNALKKSGLKIENIDVVELNEAFAAQATHCAKVLGIAPEKMNRRGGSIAIGHPLGMTGARMIGTLFNEMERT